MVKDRDRTGLKYDTRFYCCDSWYYIKEDYPCAKYCPDCGRKLSTL